MGKVISLVNPKGGSGKSTLTLCLSEVFENSMIIDFDPQACLWSWYQERIANNRDKHNHSIQVEFYGMEELSIERLDALSQFYDYVFIDCPGESEAGEKTRTALVYSDLVIIPVHGSDFDITSLLNHLAPLLEDAAASNIKGGKIMFLPVFVNPLARIDRVVNRFKGLGIEVMQGVFKTRQVLKVFPEQGVTLSEFIESGRFARDRIQAREAMSNVLEIAQQVVFHSRGQ